MEKINWETIEFEFVGDNFIKHEEEMELLDIDDSSNDSTLSAIDEMEIDEDFNGDIEQIIQESLTDPNFGVFAMKIKRNPKRKQKNGTKNFSCDICDVKLPSMSYLKRHYDTKGHQRKLMKTRIGPEIKSERIEELTELSSDEKELLPLFDEQISQFQSLEGFEEVLNVEIPKPPPKIETPASFHCEPCNKSFAHRCHYTQHIKTIHSGFKPFKCTRCGKKFSTLNDLMSHEAKHVGLKPFRCTQCPKSYNNKVDLKRHEKNHGSQAPHPCEICGRGFVRRDHLEKHYQSHERKGKKQLKNAFQNGVNFL